MKRLLEQFDKDCKPLRSPFQIWLSQQFAPKANAIIAITIIGFSLLANSIIFDFIGQIRFMHTNFYALITMSLILGILPRFAIPYIANVRDKNGYPTS